MGYIFKGVICGVFSPNLIDMLCHFLSILAPCSSDAVSMMTCLWVHTIMCTHTLSISLSLCELIVVLPPLFQCFMGRFVVSDHWHESKGLRVVFLHIFHWLQQVGFLFCDILLSSSVFESFWDPCCWFLLETFGWNLSLQLQLQSLQLHWWIVSRSLVSVGIETACSHCR